MLTLLYLIHQWFYSSPKERPQINSEKESKGRAKFQIEVGIPTSEETFRRSNCQPEFQTRFGLRTVYKISATVVVEKVQVPQEPSKYLEMSIEEKFRAAVRVIHSLPKDGPYQPSNSTKLKFYGLYKQSTEGKNTTPKPGFWDVIGRAKWESWNKHGDMTKDGAMNEYVDCLKEIVETMSFNGDVEDFLDSIGPFYEFVTLQGNEMKDIKEKIEEFSSSNGSSLANSIGPSVDNSKENSPAKSLQNGNDDDEEEEVSTSERAEVIIGTSSATYEHHKKSHNSQNGDAYKMTNGDYSPINNVPPPAPRHSYSSQNGHVKHALANDNEEDEVLTLSTNYNVSCKEDLEQDAEEENHPHPKAKLTSSIDTIASGTESEKYYSGDSDPEMEEKFANSMFLANNGSYPGTSAAALAQEKQRQFVTAQLVHSANGEGSHNLKKSTNNPNKKSFKGYISPKNSTAIIAAADVATQQTVERLNRDVDHILARLRILEAAYAANAEGAIRAPSNQSESGRRKRRFFGDLSPQSVAFIVMWPFAVQFIIKLIRWWWRRRRNMRAITN